MSNREVVVKELQRESDSRSLMQIIDRAASDPAFDVAKLSALLEVKEKWEASEGRKAYVSALAAFKANPPQIMKDKTVSFGAGKTSYKHATLDNASELIGAALSAHGLSHRWNVEQADGGMIRVTCILTHVQGHSEQVSMSALPDTSGSKNSIQAIGSTTSYLQRYTLFAATGLAPKDADTDGAEPHVLAESIKFKYLEDIEKAADKKAWEATWKTIVAACQAAGDIPSYDELKNAAVKKLKSLKERESEV